MQDHLLGEISETDNSVKVLYEARKIESKHEQCKLLGIVTPNALTSIDAINWEKSAQKLSRGDFCGQNHRRGKQNCPAFGKTCDKCGGKNHFKTICKSEQLGSRKGSDRSHRTKGKCTHKCDIHDVECCHDSSGNCSDNDAAMEDLAGQVQSLFYHWEIWWTQG